MISSSLYLVLFNTYNYLPEWVYTSLLPCNWIVTNFLTYSFIFCSGSGYVVVVLLNLAAFCVRLPIITWLWQLVSTKLTVFVWCNACFKGTLMQIWKSSNIPAFIWKKYVEDFTFEHLLLFEICAREICEKFVYKHSETIEYI